jgi:hypothetical protein
MTRSILRGVMRVALVAVATALATTACAAETTVTPLRQAHAHNDYLHARPLLDALDHGFASVEADIFLVDGRLLVAHTERELKDDRTLEALYLDPLHQRVRANGGSVFPGGGRFTLLVDIKTAGPATYAALEKVLDKYPDMVSVVRDGKMESKAVDVVISGNRPREVMADQSVRYAGYDGRWSDLDSELPVHLMPIVSDNWGLHFRWNGKGPIGDKDRQNLDDAVARAHAHGRRLRLWAAPDTVDAWRVLAVAGVDLINTDNLAGLETFLRSGAANR